MSEPLTDEQLTEWENHTVRPYEEKKALIQEVRRLRRNEELQTEAIVLRLDELQKAEAERDCCKAVVEELKTKLSEAYEFARDAFLDALDQPVREEGEKE